MAATVPETGWVQPEVEKRYLQYMQDHHGEIDIPRLCTTMWNAGGRHMVFTMTQFADVLPMMGRIEGRIVSLRALIESVTQEDA